MQEGEHFGCFVSRVGENNRPRRVLVLRQSVTFVDQQFIRLGVARGDFVTVETGLKVGETVVTTGAFKLRPGMAVVIDNKLAPDAKLAPKPDNS